MQPHKRLRVFLTTGLVLAFVFAWIRMPAANAAEAATPPKAPAPFDGVISKNTRSMIETGRQIFRYDPFGDEAFWGDTIKLPQAIAGQKLGGVGAGVSPKTALSVGLKVDADALPASLVDSIKKGEGRSGGSGDDSLCGPGGRREPLRHLPHARLERGGKEGPGRVLEVALGQAWLTGIKGERS
jgi:hypothetical protein